MKTILTLAAGAMLASLTSSQAVAQFGVYYGYHHRSTAFGDAASGASDLVRANGQFLKDEAEAAKTWLEVDRGREAFRYEMSEWRHQAKQQRRQELLARTEERKAAFQEDAQERAAEAQRLAQDIRDGMPVWPAALRRAEYGLSLTLIESIVRNYSTAGESLEATYRAALATEAAVLENRISGNTAISFLDRVEAVHTLRLVRELTGAGKAAGERQLAMK